MERIDAQAKPVRRKAEIVVGRESVDPREGAKNLARDGGVIGRADGTDRTDGTHRTYKSDPSYSYNTTKSLRCTTSRRLRHGNSGLSCSLDLPAADLTSLSPKAAIPQAKTRPSG